MEVQMDGQKDKRTDGWTEDRRYRWMDRRVDGQKNERTD